MNIKKIVVPLFVTLSGVLVVDKSYSAQVIKVIDFAEINEFNDGLIDGVHLRLHKNEDLAYFPLINHNSDTNKNFC